MENSSFFQRLRETGRARMLTAICLILSALLMGACASGIKKQASPPPADEIGRASETGDADQVASNEDDQEIVCRMRATTGTRFKRRICATKAQWASLDSKNQEKTDEFNREIRRSESIETGVGGTDAMGGQTIGVPR